MRRMAWRVKITELPRSPGKYPADDSPRPWSSLLAWRDLLVLVSLAPLPATEQTTAWTFPPAAAPRHPAARAAAVGMTVGSSQVVAVPAVLGGKATGAMTNTPEGHGSSEAARTRAFCAR